MKLKDMIRKISIEKSFYNKSNSRVWLDPFNMQKIDGHYTYSDLKKLTNDNYIPF